MQMAKIDIENIGQRPHIRRLTNIGITNDTPPEKIEKAVDIILYMGRPLDYVRGRETTI